MKHIISPGIFLILSITFFLVFGCAGKGGETILQTSLSTQPKKSVKQIEAGSYHTCALLTDGSLKCWGWNNDGELGIGTNIGPQTCGAAACSTVPVSVLGIAGVMDIAVGEFHTCAILLDGSVECWGDNQFGQLGNGLLTASSTPVQTHGIDNAVAIDGGSYHTCALLKNGTIKCWGRNESGELGYDSNNGPQTCNNMPCSTEPLDVSDISTAISVSTGGAHTCVMLPDKSIKCFGGGRLGQLGNGTKIDSYVPVLVTGINNAFAISAGVGNTCALLNDGSVKCWGSNTSGELGNISSSEIEQCSFAADVYPCSSKPLTVGGIGSPIAIDVGWVHTCVMLQDKTMKCWGGNTSGQLGNGTMTNSASPVFAVGVDYVEQVTTGSLHTCVLLSDGNLKCWGRSNEGQLGNGVREGPEFCSRLSCSTLPVAVSSILYE